ncbi:MAG: type II toxin-antitoxin system HipA family toxin [Thioalkalivibrio sp.]|nr:type II toxin-antitoxin system HipA family toxin [Thioalkalivibrio sp.]
MAELIALLEGERVGVVRQGEGGKLEFSYDQEWRDRRDAYPLSLSIPLARRSHPDDVVGPYLKGLLPDDGELLKRYGREFHVSPRNPFALLQHMGEDCAGAVQFVGPERVEMLADEGSGTVQWLSESELAERLRDLVSGYGAGRWAGDPGQFSLAGAQPKTALLRMGDRWGVPSGSIPTTHIIKPPARRDLRSVEVNEHLCLKLAGLLGLEVAASSVEQFDGQPAIVVTRYDRRWPQDGWPIRRHQEDACQALAVPPENKYEAHGGPGAAEIIRLLIEESSEPDLDVGAFLDAFALNWAIGGTDAHAKNYSLLIEAGSVRLAPLYDLISILPYDQSLSYRRAKLAMRVGKEYLLWKIRGRHWQDLAERSLLDPGPVLDRVAELLKEIPAAVSSAASEVREEGLGGELVDALEQEISAHATDCLSRL